MSTVKKLLGLSPGEKRQVAVILAHLAFYQDMDEERRSAAIKRLEEDEIDRLDEVFGDTEEENWT